MLLIFQKKDWCCQTGLNCRPLHYQWSALPLSYGSVPRTIRIGQKGFHGRPDPCHKLPARASACQRAARSKMAGIRAIRPRSPSFMSVAGRFDSRFHRTASLRPGGVDNDFKSSGGIIDRKASSNGFGMTDNNHERERQTGRPAKKDARQDRLKLALRENLKRRKSQARGRDDVGNSSDKGSSHHRGETKPRS
jgi:hypothetical protein